MTLLDVVILKLENSEKYRQKRGKSNVSILLQQYPCYPIFLKKCEKGKRDILT